MTTLPDSAARLSPEREAEIAERTPKRAAALTAWLNQFSPLSGGQRDLENAETVLEEDVPALLAELAAVRAERDQAQTRNAELEVERHTTNEALSDAAEQLRRDRDRITELEAELAKYVGKEPTTAEEMAYLSRSVAAASAVCDKAERQARRWENPLPVPQWVTEVRQALELAPTTYRAEEA